MTLLRIVGDGTDRLIELRQTKLQIGRARTNDIVLPDAEKGVSRTHAELRYENGRYVLVDLQSQNGTWVDGQRIERAEVRIGAEIVLGEYRMYLEQGTAAAVLSPGRDVTAKQPRAETRADDLRIREEPVTRELPVVQKGAASQPAASGTPRRAVSAAAAAAAMVVLVAAMWVLTSRSTDESSQRARSQAEAPHTAAPPSDAAPAPPAGPDSGSSSPATDSETARASAPAPVSGSAQDDSSSRRRVDVAPASVPASAGGSGVRRKPGESLDAWRSRAAALETRYDFSTAALTRGDFAAAAGGFEAILLEEPGFRDAPQLLVQAQAGLRASARTLAESGDRLDAAGDWLGAVQKYEQARQIHSGIPGLEARLRHVREKLRAEGTNAFNLARQHEANGRIDDAVKEYEKAVQWLPAQDPNRQLARARLEQLKRS